MTHLSSATIHLRAVARGRTVRHLGAVLSAVALMTVTTALPASAGDASHAGDPACGDTITADTTLHANLVDCPDFGLVIGADDITLDLNGHTIDGDAAPQDPCPENCDLGIDNSAGHSGLVVENGTVKEFTFGVAVGGAADNVLSRLTVTDNDAMGIVVFDSPHMQLERSIIARNGLDTDGAGLGIFSSSGGVLSGNLIADNGDVGVYAEGMDDYRIVGNTVVGNPEAGLQFNGSGNALSGNTIDRNGDGIDMSGDDNEVRANRITRSHGCDDGCGYGVSFEGGSRNTITRNLVSGSLWGIRVDGGTGIVSHNTVRSSAEDNIVIPDSEESSPGETLVVGNLVTGAGDDGIDVDNPTTTIAGNVAAHNGDLGIEAVPGVIDGGGNHAAGNGDPRQCTYVNC